MSPLDSHAELLPTDAVRTQKLMDYQTVGLGLALGWLLLIIAIILTCATIIGGLIVWPISRSIYKRNCKNVVLRLEIEARSKFSSFVGKPTKYIDTSACGYGNQLNQMSASGMAYADGRLYVLEEGTAAEIPWSKIRSWKWNVDGYDTLVGGDLSTLTSTQNANQNSRARAHRESGFTLMTTDIDKPEWRFQTSDTTILKKWMEVLTQMKEGRLPCR